MSLVCKHQARQMLLFTCQIVLCFYRNNAHAKKKPHLYAKNIFSTNWFTLDVINIGTVACHRFLLVLGIIFVVPSFFLHWKPSKSVGCFRVISYMFFFFLDNYVLCILMKYFHSNHNKTSVLPKICFSLQPPYHWKSCVHLNCDVYYIVDNFLVFVHPERFSHLSICFPPSDFTT